MYKVGHRMNSFSFNPLFNYPSFIKTLNTYQLEFHVVNWLNFIQKPSQTQPYSLFTTNHYYFYSESLTGLQNIKSSVLSTRYYKMTKTLCTLLFKLFINNNASLNNLSINIPSDSKDHFFVEIYDFILKKPNFISNIENFILISISPNLQPFLASLPSILSSIKHLNFYLPVDTFTKNLENIIQSQAHLSSFTFSSIASINYLFYASKHCSKTLTSIRFSDCDFRNVVLPFKPLKYLTQLKYLHFINCLGLKLHIFQPLLDISTPLKIKSLTLHCSNTENALIQLLIQKIGAYLENLFINPIQFSTNTFDCIINNCENIKFLYLLSLGFDSSKALQLITHFKDKIKYLTIEYYNSAILNELGQNLPVNLKYLNLNLLILTNDLKTFLENCKNIELKKLLIRNRMGDYDKLQILQILKTFVQEKNLEYLSYTVTSINGSVKDLTKEIQSFVKSGRYEYSVLDITDFE